MSSINDELSSSFESQNLSQGPRYDIDESTFIILHKFFWFLTLCLLLVLGYSHHLMHRSPANWRSENLLHRFFHPAFVILKWRKENATSLFLKTLIAIWITYLDRLCERRAEKGHLHHRFPTERYYNSHTRIDVKIYY